MNSVDSVNPLNTLHKKERKEGSRRDGNLSPGRKDMAGDGKTWQKFCPGRKDISGRNLGFSLITFN